MVKRFAISAGGFKGLDERAGCSTGLNSLPRLVNMRVKENGQLEKRCGFGLLGRASHDKPVTALWKGVVNEEECLLAACSNEIYGSVNGGTTFNKLASVKSPVHCFIPFGGKVYSFSGEIYSLTGTSATRVEGYAPTIAVSCSMDGAGTALESPNVITPKRRVLYNGDGKSNVLFLPEKNVEYVHSLKIDGVSVLVNKYTLEGDKGKISFSETPPEGLNNIEICYSVATDYESRFVISDCQYAAVFENRLFLYGNPDYPNKVFRSELADGLPSCEYFTELAYHSLDKEVTALIPCYNRLLIFSNDYACFTYAELKTDSLGATYTSFPLYELHSSKGNLAAGISCSVDNTPVTICRDGLNRWVSTAIADERSASVFSQRAFRFMSEIDSYDTVALFNRKARSELWLCTPKGTLIYNYKLDCFYQYSLENIRSLYEDGNDLLMGMSDGRICVFSERHKKDINTPIKAEFETPFCTFGAPYSIKSLQGVSVSFAGQDEVTGAITLCRGSRPSEEMLLPFLRLKAADADGFRRVFKRINLKRFFSVKVKFDTDCESVVISDLHLFGKCHDGCIRIN